MSDSQTSRGERIASIFLVVVMVVGLGVGLVRTLAPLADQMVLNWRAVPIEAQVTNLGEQEYALGRQKRIHHDYFVRYSFQAPHPKTQVPTRYGKEVKVTGSVYRELKAGRRTIAIQYMRDDPTHSGLVTP